MFQHIGQYNAVERIRSELADWYVSNLPTNDAVKNLTGSSRGLKGRFDTRHSTGASPADGCPEPSTSATNIQDLGRRFGYQSPDIGPIMFEVSGRFSSLR